MISNGELTCKNGDLALTKNDDELTCKNWDLTMNQYGVIEVGKIYVWVACRFSLQVTKYKDQIP